METGTEKKTDMDTDRNTATLNGTEAETDSETERKTVFPAQPPSSNYPLDVVVNREGEGERDGERERTRTREREADGDSLLSSSMPVTGLWQRGKSVLECNRYMLDKQIECDVWFVLTSQATLQEGDGEREKGEREKEKEDMVGAHSYMLRSRSGLLFAMLVEDSGRSTRSNIYLHNTRSEVLWQFLRYLYCEDLNLEADSVTEVLELADKYDVVTLQQACLRFLHDNLTVLSACDTLESSHRYNDPELRKDSLLFIQSHGNDVVQSAGMAHLCRECLNEVLTLEGLGLTPSLTQEVTDRWAQQQCQDNLQEATPYNKQHSLGDVLYVKKDTQKSRRFNIHGNKHKRIDDDQENLPPTLYPKLSSGSRTPDSDNISIASETSLCSSNSTQYSRSSTGSKRSGMSVLSKQLSCSWPELYQVTRFSNIEGFVLNKGVADAVSFIVNRNIYLYGFGIYGNVKQSEEASYKVDTVLTRKKRDVVLETISISGVGVILPAMLERPVKVDKGKLYTLEVYVHGPPCHCGTQGESSVSLGNVNFVFSKPSNVKGNRTGVSKGQIPRLYYLPCSSER